jgi:stalled ribosome rescue protein Dom34
MSLIDCFLVSTGSLEETMQGHYHAVIWIDHRQARILHFSMTDVDKLVVGPENPVRHLHHKANTIGSGHAPENQKFLEEVVRSVADAGAILVVGPAGEKNELVKHIKHSHPEMIIKIEGVESADHPSDQELVAYARRYLKSADVMRPQI